MTEQPVGPRCGNNPNVRLTPGDRKAVDDFKARLALQASAKPYIDSAAWVDGDPLMEVIAVTLWEHCETGDGGIVHDDPRTIAAFAAAVARAHAAVSSAPADRSAIERVRSVLESEAVVGRSALDYRGLITSALMADDAPGPSRMAGEAQQPETEPCGAWGGCTLARGHNIGQADIPENHRPSAVGAQQPETQAADEPPCTCAAAAGDCFAPAGHYADCPAAVSQPGKEA